MFFSKPEKLIAVGPLTDTYRQRIRAHERAKEHDRRLELTLRKKYNIFDTDTLRPNGKKQSQTGPSHYNDLSLPSPSTSGTLSPGSKSEQEPPRCRPRRQRRTVSDSSKDRKAGAYVHVKGKRKAPSPPTSETGELASTLSPSMSTLARKKRQAPPPPPASMSSSNSSNQSSQSPKSTQSPKSIKSSQSPQSPQSPIHTVLNGGLFDEAEINAIMNGQTIPNPTPHKSNGVMEVQSTDTLKLERGILRSNRDSIISSPPRSPTIALEVPNSTKPASTSPIISPRPWYKRSSSHNKDQSIPFKREITLKTMEKRKSKDAKKDSSPPLPEVGYSRSSSLFDGFFGRGTSSHLSHNEDQSDKRRSGIGMPNISELDRQAAEIIQKEKENELNRAQADNDKYYDTPADAASSNASKASTKELINRFEDTNPVKFTVNSAFVEKVDQYFNKQTAQTELGTANTPVKNRQLLSSISTTSTSSSSSSSSMVQSIFSSIQQTNTQSTTKTAVASENTPLQPDTGDKNLQISNTSTGTTWICTYCTLENYNWRVICEVCERIRPYDKTKAPLAVTEPSLSIPSPRFRYIKKEPEDPPIKDASPSVITHSSSTNNASPNSDPKKFGMAAHSSSAPSVAVALAKSASETSVGGSVNRIMKTKQLVQSPRRYDANRGEGLIDSSAVITTKPSVFVAPQPAQHANSKPTSNSPDIDQMRAVRIAKFGDEKFKRTASEEPPRIAKRASQTPEGKSYPECSVSDGQPHKLHEKPLLTDRGSLEREKQRLRDMIRAMNAKTLADKYPVNSNRNEVVQQEGRPLATEVGQGAIKKVFTRRSEPPVDTIITNNTNFQDEKTNGNVAMDKLALPTNLNLKPRQPPPDSLLLLPSPIAEINEDDLSPSSPAAHALVDQQIDSIYAKLKDKDNAAQNSVEMESYRRNTEKGLDDFRATLKKTRNRTNTLVLNKILKDLEVAIGEGQHEQAAKLAMDLAKMKVSLTVTKQGPLNDFPTPISDIKLSNVIDENFVSKTNLSSVELEGATALPQNEPHSGTLAFGWTCPLCTLINSPNRPGCVACSETRPASYVVPAAYRVNEPYKMPAELHKFLNNEENLPSTKENCLAKEIQPPTALQPKNDLNKTTANRRSAEIFNIIIAKDKEASPTKEEQKSIVQTQIVMTAMTVSPNITKSRYRGVDNYNPHIQNVPTTAIPYKSPLVNPIVNPILKPARTTKLPQLVGVVPKRTTTESKTSTVLSQVKITKISPSSSSNESGKHYSQLLHLDNTNIVPNAEPFECTVCFCAIAIGAGVVLRDCIHTFCRECIINTVKYSEEAEVKCPYANADYSCDCVIQEREIRALLSKEAYDEHLAVSLKVAQHRMENAFQCRTPSCKGWCVFEDNVNEFRCPICRITNCLTCRVRMICILLFLYFKLIICST